MITVEMSAPYLSLTILVGAIATAATRVNRSGRTEGDESSAHASAVHEWESKLRELAEGQVIQGHDFDTLAAQPWFLLDIERDVFYVGDLNGCQPLADAGLRFEVVKDSDRSGDAAFLAAFIEHTNNDKDISWSYWIGRMPSLSEVDASRLLVGLDPDLYANIDARPVPGNNVAEACQKAVALERLAKAEGKARDTAAGWLAWARARQFAIHPGFILGVYEFHPHALSDADGRALSPSSARTTLGAEAIPLPGQASATNRTLTSHATASDEQGAAADGPGWSLREPERHQGYSWPLYRLLKAAHTSGGSKPKARDVLVAFKAKMPSEVVQVNHDGFSYFDATGNAKPADLRAIAQAIRRMTK